MPARRDGIKSAPKSARSSPVEVQSTRESVDWPTFGLFPRLAPTCPLPLPLPLPLSLSMHPGQELHVVFILSNLISCSVRGGCSIHRPSTTVASSVPLGTAYCAKNVSNRLPRGRKFSCKRTRPNRPDGQVKSRLYASLPLRRDKYSKGR